MGGPPSATLYLPDDADILAFANCPGVNINYVMKNVLLVFGTEVYETALQIMAEDERIDVYDIPKDVYRKAIRASASRIAKHKAISTNNDRELIWKTKSVYTEGFSIPVPKEIPGGVLKDMKIHCYLSQKTEMVGIRLWNELASGQKSAFVKMLIRAYLDRPVIEPRFYEDLFEIKKSNSARGTGSLKKREWVKKESSRKKRASAAGKESPAKKKKLAEPEADLPVKEKARQEDARKEPEEKPATEPVPATTDTQSDEFDLFSAFSSLIQ